MERLPSITTHCLKLSEEREMSARNIYIFFDEGKLRAFPEDTDVQAGEKPEIHWRSVQEDLDITRVVIRDWEYDPPQGTAKLWTVSNPNEKHAVYKYVVSATVKGEEVEPLDPRIRNEGPRDDPADLILESLRPFAEQLAKALARKH